MRRIAISFLAALSMIFMPRIAFAQCESGEVVVKIGGYFDANHFARHRASTLLRDTINKELQGKACAQYLTDKTKYTGALGVTALQSGEINLFAGLLSELASFERDYQIFGLPFAFRNLRSVEQFQGLSNDSFSGSLSSRGVRPLAYWHKGFEQIASSRMVVSASDAAGLKFRRGEARTFEALLSSLNAVSVAVPQSDLEAALKQKRVDAVTADWQQIQVQKLGATLGNISETNHRFEGYHVLTPTSWWGQLEKTLRKQISEIVVRVSRQINFETSNRIQGFRRSVMRSGAKVWKPTSEQRGSWQKSSVGTYASYFTPPRSQLKVWWEDANSGL